MNENKVAAAILTFALWNGREKASAKQVGSEDWKLVTEEYAKILSELNRRGTP